LDKYLHSSVKHALQDLFSNTTQNLVNRLKKIVAIGKSVSGEEMLDLTEEIKVRGC
jgi:hypothetical protein